MIGGEGDSRGYGISYWDNEKVMKLKSGDDCITLNLMKSTVLYTLKEWI